ncbi:peptidoglycan DD-metalloendopeptidase family protein [Streptomyces sp. NPDC058620]|uniref:M23 family metallopeptidase n=1 Tax=Streptomyces sp. NPDC058620 TaxID=3346560 RepID=UPI0036509223
MSHRRRRTSSITRMVTALAVAAAGTLLTVGPSVAGEAGAAAAAPGPEAAVTGHLHERGQWRAGVAAAGDRPVVEVTREAGAWAHGTAVLATEPGSDRMPEGWLFIAHRDKGSWQVAFDGEPRFAELSARSTLTRAAEKPLFAEQDGKQPTARTTGITPLAGSDFRTGMALPWANGQTWTMTSGPHGWGGSEAPWSSADFAGGDQAVRATRGGTAYTMCTGWVRVIHDRGYSTDYYHLWSSISANGTAVGAGAHLGYTGTDVTCGGAAYGRHVHFGLRQNSAYVGLAGHGLGKWVMENGGAAYQGSALHGSARVGAGGNLYNYGALGLNQGVIDANGGGSVNKRTGPGTGYGISGSVADGATVTVSCSSNGTSHTGRYGTTSLWNRLSDGTWVSDAYMWTGVNGAINGYC